MISVSQKIADFRPVGHSASLGDFDEWLLSLAAGSDCVVALAQAAPRLLHARGLLNKLEQEVICERALPFLSPEQIRGRSFLLFDDTISFGSTMHDVYRRLIDGGAGQIKCAALLVDRREFLGDRESGEARTPSPYLAELRPEYLCAASADDVALFHAIENQQFRRIGRPFTYDFPVFQCSAPPELTSLTPALVAAYLGETEKHPFLWPLAGRIKSSELYSFSIPISSSSIEPLFPGLKDVVNWQAFSKVRVYVDSRDHAFRFVPMVQIDSRSGARVDALPEGVSRDVYRVLSDALSNSELNEKQKRIAYHRALTFALACELGQRLWSGLIVPGLGETIMPNRPALSRAETAFLLGANCAEAIDEILARGWNGSSPFEVGASGRAQVKPERFPAAPPENLFSSKRLWHRMREVMLEDDADPDWRPTKHRRPYENLGCMLSLLFKVIDESARPGGGPERLERGLTFSDLLVLLNSFGARCSPIELSAAIDALLDGGLLVPQLLLDDESGIVRRGFRSGENETSDDTVQLKAIITQLLGDRRDSGEPALSEKGFSKTFVILKKLFGDALPFTLGLRTYGLEPFVNDEVLREWSNDHRITQLNEGRMELIPVDRAPKPLVLDSGAKASLRSTFDFLASLDTATGTVPGSKMLLLLSTCNSYENTFNACAYEIACWLRRERYNFERVLSLLTATDWKRVDTAVSAELSKVSGDLFGSGGDDSLARARARSLDAANKGARLSSLLQNCREYLIEFKNKTSVFNDEFDVIAQGVRDHFSRNHQMKMFAEERFFASGYLNKSVEASCVSRRQIIDHVQECAWRLMDVVEVQLCEAGYWRLGGPEVASPRALASSADAMERYDAAVEGLIGLGVSRRRVRMFADIQLNSPISSIDELKLALEASSERFYEIRETFDLWCPVVDRHDERPYSARKFAAARGFESEIWRDAYICVLDIIRSKASSVQTKHLILEALGGNEVCHEQTGNDGYIFVTRDWDHARAVVQSIRARTGAYLSADGYGGVRASVVRGDAIVMRKHGALMILDREGTPEIPRAVYPLDQLKDMLDRNNLRQYEGEGITVDARIADELKGGAHVVAPLGTWSVKGFEALAFFVLPAKH